MNLGNSDSSKTFGACEAPLCSMNGIPGGIQFSRPDFRTGAIIMGLEPDPTAAALELDLDPTDLVDEGTGDVPVTNLDLEPPRLHAVR